MNNKGRVFSVHRQYLTRGWKTVQHKCVISNWNNLCHLQTHLWRLTFEASLKGENVRKNRTIKSCFRWRINRTDGTRIRTNLLITFFAIPSQLLNVIVWLYTARKSFLFICVPVTLARTYVLVFLFFFHIVLSFLLTCMFNFRGSVKQAVKIRHIFLPLTLKHWHFKR